MMTKERIKKEIDRLSEVELEKVYLFLSSLTQGKKEKSQIRALSLNGKLDNKNIRYTAYE